MPCKPVLTTDANRLTYSRSWQRKILNLFGLLFEMHWVTHPSSV